MVAARSRPRYTWRFWDVANSNLLTAGSLNFVLNTVGQLPDLSALGVIGDYTVRRNLGKIAATSENAGESNAIDGFGWGIRIADDDAVAAGALPEVVEDASNWLAFGQVFVSLASFGGSTSVHPLVIDLIDSKAMRKVNENHQSVVLSMQAVSGNQATISVHASGRLLVSHGQR